MKTFPQLPLATAMLAGTLLCVGPVHAAGGRVAASVPVLVGGIGKDSEATMRREAGHWPLRMVFSERKDNELVADVDLVVRDAHGRRVLKLDDTGPMTYAKLPPGRYSVEAVFEGQRKLSQVTLDGRRGQDLFFHWRGEPQRGQAAAG